MFTGIIQSVGRVVSTSSSGDGLKLSLDATGLAAERLQPGDSIAVNGACLTINRCQQNIVDFDVSSETLSKCLMAGWKVGDRVNLEPALTLQTPIGGHLLSGHIDGTAKVVECDQEQGQEQEQEREFIAMQLETDCAIGKFIAVKGSVAIDGVSLTTNKVEDENQRTRFEVMLVAHTLEHTTLRELAKDSQVHVEVDQIARYIHRINECTETRNS